MHIRPGAHKGRGRRHHEDRSQRFQWWRRNKDAVFSFPLEIFCRQPTSATVLLIIPFVDIHPPHSDGWPSGTRYSFCPRPLRVDVLLLEVLHLQLSGFFYQPLIKHLASEVVDGLLAFDLFNDSYHVEKVLFMPMVFVFKHLVPAQCVWMSWCWYKLNGWFPSATILHLFHQALQYRFAKSERIYDCSDGRVSLTGLMSCPHSVAVAPSLTPSTLPTQCIKYAFGVG